VFKIAMIRIRIS